jgi:hypothetical protein
MHDRRKNHCKVCLTRDGRINQFRTVIAGAAHRYYTSTGRHGYGQQVIDPGYTGVLLQEKTIPIVILHCNNHCSQ